jgi:hypothetical protein
MRSTYKYLTYAIAALVVLQAGFIAWGFFGANDWITSDGGIVDKEYLECEGDCEMQFFAEWGFAFHMFFVGFLLIPLTSLVTLVVSFFAKVPGGVRWAATIVGLVILQVFVLPMLSHEVNPIFGALHGINAMALFCVAYLAGRRASAYARVGTTDASTPVPA